MEPYRFSPAELAVTTVTEFVATCQAEPLLAAEHLQSGYFEPWLRDAGRPDLADAAARIRQSDAPSRERLQQFVDTAVGAGSRSRTAASRQTPAKPEPAKPRTRKVTDR
jgi:hypothetical protein